MHLYPSVSTYVYSLNDPIGKKDPDGKQVIGGQLGIEVGAGLGFSFNIAVTYDTRGSNLNLLGSFGRGIVAGKSLNANVGLIVGERYTRTSDLIGESVEGSVDVSAAVKAGGYAFSESKDSKGKATGRGAHIFSWSPGVGAKASMMKTTTIDIICFISSLFSSSENESQNKDNNQDKSESETEKNNTSSEANSQESKYTDTMRDLLGL